VRKRSTHPRPAARRRTRSLGFQPYPKDTRPGRRV
jgi:hypothetical protein